MGARTLVHNSNGGYRVHIPGAYIRENAATFGAGTLLEREAEGILTQHVFARRTGWKLCITHLRSDPEVSFSYPVTVWKRLTWHENQPCLRGCDKYGAPGYRYINACCRDVPCFPPAHLMHESATKMESLGYKPRL